MAKVTLPVFSQRMSTQSLMRNLTQQGAYGCLIKAGPAYHVVSVDRVHRALRRKESALSLAGLATASPLSIEGGMGTISLAGLKLNMSAPLYVCPRQDQSSFTAAICTVHGLRMVPS